jgi:hypothetical protein
VKKLAVAGVASVALLGLALLWSARLVEDVAPVPPPEPTALRGPAPDDAPRARLAPEPPRPIAPTPVPAPPSGAAPLPVVPAEPQPAPPPPPQPDAVPPERLGEVPLLPEGDDPFAEDSRELAYAFRLAENPDSTPDQVRNAAEVFERCLKAQPGDERCYRGLTAAQSRLNPPDVPSAPRSKQDTFVPRPGFEGKAGKMKPSPINR